MTGNPETAIDQYNYLRGRWRDALPFTTGGNGRTSTGLQTTYMFDGDPVARTGWTEANAGNVPGDRRGLLTAGPYTFSAGQRRTFELAYVFGQSPQPGVNAGLARLRQKADELRTQYAAGAYAPPPPATPPVVQDASLSFGPNPTGGQVTVYAVLPSGSATGFLRLL